MFIYTIGDVIGVTLFLGGLFIVSLCYLADKLAPKKRPTKPKD